ncbi:EAL domain-containing protein [Dasania sp. GY-MA-18]|uniref:EAL domain-containing protein n=1 Tax=Dasania phycosphaerae TaxID=2950436 RepID=A0A9J6RLY2_9GAMM|nr:MULTISPECIES: EAL domain-containing protein [Dasania]MCR8923091.1 EAL domain-containing protein [Dasania sp. GY-MA-18]MCZ0865523.1 EAL domain-containing protein [Dasania phycosphaerae]MCZ0869248.1 EAL domain-containing protein [Dasania phycosphaerae]
MARKSTIKLLLVNESDNAGEHLVSIFRNAGRVARAHRVASAEELFTAFKNDDDWDLLIADDFHPEIKPEQCLEQRKKSKLQLPVIVIRENCNSLAKLFEAGASDVIDPADQARLCHAAFREVDKYNIIRKNRLLNEQLSEAEQRCEMLLDQSQDAIAYISDGMIIGSNQLFAETFGYSAAEDLDCFPIVDMIADEDQDKFKGLLKNQLTSDDSTQFNFSGRKENGEQFDSHVQLSCATYDDEQCVQLTISQRSNGGESVASMDHDPATGLYSHDYFIAQLDSHIKQAAAGTTISTVMFISIDQFGSLRRRIGISSIEAVIADIAKHIQSHTQQDSCLAHYCDDGYTILLSDTGAQKALELAQELCKSIESHIVEVHKQSLQCTVSIGVVALDGKVTDPYRIIDGAYETCEQIRIAADNKHIGNSAQIHIPERERKSLGDASGDAELDQVLEEALEDQLFSLLFHPIVSLRGSSGDHYEVLVNYSDENEQLLSANEFIGQLNFQAVNTRLDRWIILEATKLLSAERDKGQNINLLINLTANALHDEGLIPWLSVALKAGGLPADTIAFQFSEQDLNNNLTAAINFAEALQKSGCRFSITNFGMADEPVKLLKHVKANYVRLSNGYTEQLQNSNDTEALKALVGSINENNSKAIIPDIQNASALAVLWQIGADFIQGDYLAGPSKTMDHEFTDIA